MPFGQYNETNYLIERGEFCDQPNKCQFSRSLILGVRRIRGEKEGWCK